MLSVTPRSLSFVSGSSQTTAKNVLLSWKYIMNNTLICHISLLSLYHSPSLSLTSHSAFPSIPPPLSLCVCSKVIIYSTTNKWDQSSFCIQNWALAVIRAHSIWLHRTNQHLHRKVWLINNSVLWIFKYE